MTRLPSPISAYFEANARLDADAMLAPFAAEAIVRDEGNIHRGNAEIGAWIRQASIATSAVATPTTSHCADDVHLVTAEVSGAFAGSPIELPLRFRLRDGQIAELEIG